MDLVDTARNILLDSAHFPVGIEEMQKDYELDKKNLTDSILKLHEKVNNLLSEAYEVQAESHRLTAYLERFLKW